MSEKMGDRSILILSGVKGDTRRYRTFHPYEQLSLAGVECSLSHLTSPDLPEKVFKAGLAILHRVPMDRYVETLLAGMRQRGALVIVDVDDLVFEPEAFQWIDSPDFQDPVRARLYQEEMHRHRLTLEACQAVTASTDYLAGQVRQLGKPAWVHPNAFSLEMLALAEAAHSQHKAQDSRIIIGYASGTRTHDRDFALVRPALAQILQQHPQTEVWVIGPLDPGKDWGELGQRVKRLPFVPWRKLPGVLVQFDINLAPLVMDNPFAQSKSAIKYMEAGLVRVPTIASPTDAFRYAIRSGENGYLAANPTEWVDALDLLVRQADIRTVVGERAYADVLARCHPGRRSAELLSSLNHASEQVVGTPFWTAEAVTRLRARASEALPAQALIDPDLERSPSLGRMALYSLRHRGVRTLLMQLWIFIRRWIAPLVPFRRTS